MKTFPAHPVLFLEPVVHLVMGAGLLGWGNDPVLIAIGVLLVIAGIGFGIPAMRIFCHGAFSVEGNQLTTNGGFLWNRSTCVSCAEIVDVRARRGARLLRHDPIHVLLSYVSDYGSLELKTRDGQMIVLNPVSTTNANSFVERWRAGAAPQTMRQPWKWSPHVAFLGLAILFGAAAIAQLGDGINSIVILLLGIAGLMELFFWLSLIFLHRKDPEPPTLNGTTQ